MNIEEAVAPCGVNCSVCYAHLRSKNNCGGCWGADNLKPKHCVVCKIRHCEYLAKSGSHYCYDCEMFPCKRLKEMNKRYVLKYKISLLENLGKIKKIGVQSFILTENQRWTCKCGGLICEHTGRCLLCNQTR
jgi:hypothetical protein